MQTLIEARARVKREGINKIYNLYQVRKPKSVMLHVLFNLVHNELWSRAVASKDQDYKERLAYQRAIFELASEEEMKRFKNPSIQPGHQSQ